MKSSFFSYIITKRTYSIALVVFYAFFITLISPLSVVQAIDQEFYSENNILYVDPTASASSCSVSSSSISSTSSGNTSTSAFSIDEVKTFASVPVTATWNISDSTAEEWFLKQSGARPTVTRYGLSASNIGTVTAAVKAAGVSPVFFYLYTVNEGGGAGGFINHYTGETSGGATGNATRDAEYLVKQAQDKSSGPATGGGEPSSMPTAEAKQILQDLPSGSIGIVYIQATSAVTAELEDLSGKTGAWSGLFNKPLSNSMQNIKTMGGNPLEGGTTVSSSSGNCNTTVTGTGMAKAINWAIMIAKNDGYGYDQPHRLTGYEKWKSDPNCTSGCGDFDCSSFVSAAITVAGYAQTNPNFDTSGEAGVLKSLGFEQVASSASTSDNLQAGDILISPGHTELYAGDGKIVGAHHNENGGISGGSYGDQSGTEVSVGSFYDNGWISVWRATK